MSTSIRMTSLDVTVIGNSTLVAVSLKDVNTGAFGGVYL
jgi:hypothetical protein